MEMVIPKPLPDELYIGYLGRLLAINGVKAFSPMQATPLLKELFPAVAELAGGKNIYERMLLNILQCHPVTFFHEHSLSRLCSYVKPKNNKETSDKIYWKDMRKAHQRYRFCEECAQHDRAKFGFSYWRRIHQLPGADWCLDHSAPLFEATSKYPYYWSPGALLVKRKYEAVTSTGKSVSPAIKKLLQFLADFIDGDLMLTRKEALGIVRLNLSHRGYTPNDISYGQLDQDLADFYGMDWIEKHASKMVVKKPGLKTVLNPAKNILKLCYRGEFIYLSIMFSFMFDSYEDLALKIKENSKQEISNSNSSKVVRGIYENTLYNNFILCGGDFLQVAERLGISSRNLSERLRRRGLVSLKTEQGVSSRWAAMHAFLVERRDLNESARIGKMPVHELIGILRDTSEPMTRALLDMRSKKISIS